MIVTDERLTERARELLAVLQAAGTWLTRTELADKVNKTRLNPHEVALLEGMVEAGYVEKQETTRGIVSANAYRAISEG